MENQNDADVIVVGAGPAGLVAGATTAEKGHKTLIIERSKAIGYPIHDSGGTFREIIDGFNLSKKVIANWISGFRFISPSGYKVDFEIEKKLGAVLDRREINRELAIKAADSGAEILVNENVLKDLIKEQNTLKGVNVSGFHGKKEYLSKVVIDSSGFSGILANSMNVHSGIDQIRRAHGAQFEMTNVDLEGQDLAEIYFGNDVAPGGYGWIFPKGEDIANVGVGILHGMGHKDISIRKYLQRFIKKHPVSSERCKNAQQLEYHSGTFPIGPMFKEFTNDNYIAIGDAACQGSPHLGEGIRFVMKCGKIAGEVASDAISDGDTSHNRLKKCEKRIWKEVYPNYNLLYRIHEYACSKTDESWESTLKKLEKMAGSDTGKELGKKVVRGDVSKGYLLKTLPRFAMSNLVKIIK